MPTKSTSRFASGSRPCFAASSGSPPRSAMTSRAVSDAFSGPQPSDVSALLKFSAFISGSLPPCSPCSWG